jgi:hypothetical protein
LEPSSGPVGDLERRLVAGFEDRLGAAQGRLDELLPIAARSGGDGARIASSFATIAGHARAAWSDPPERRPAELLLELELALLLLEAWARLAELQIAVSGHD